MLDFFEIRAEGRLHPLLYRAALGCFALARFWEGSNLAGPHRGRSFEAALYTFCEREHFSLRERAGSRTLCDATSASGLRHESDGVISAANLILHIETKHLTDCVSKNDLMIFNQKGLDFDLTGDPRVRSRPLYRLFLSGSPLSREARKFALLWGIVVVEPDVMPLPTLHWLTGSTFSLRLGAQADSDRIWREVPTFVAPLQERIKRLPACLKGIEEIVTSARIGWVLDQLQDSIGIRLWHDLDCHDSSWLEQVYAKVMPEIEIETASIQGPVPSGTPRSTSPLISPLPPLNRNGATSGDRGGLRRCGARAPAGLRPRPS